MNKSVQILLLIALFPMIGIAREETLEERKQRIVRKYLRERMTIDQSDMNVPTDLLEDERVTDSEKFKGAEVDLQRQDSVSSPAVRPPQPQAVPRIDKNWLTGDSEETIDTFGNRVDPYTGIAIDSADELWSTWDGTSGEKTATEFDRQDRRSYDPSQNPYSQQNNSGRFNSREQESSSTFGRSQNSGFGSSRTDIFGRKQSSSSQNSGLNIPRNQTRTYGANPEQGMLNSPFPQLNSSSQSQSSDQERAQNYKPYKSPYEQQREQRSQQQQNTQPQQEQELKRPDSYQKWKERNKTWDPTSDDAYINEMMQQNKR